MNVIAAIGTPAAPAARAATSSIPIVFRIGVDPVELGLVASLARPGGNLTGSVSLNTELEPKRLQFLQEVVPTAKVIATLINPSSPNANFNRVSWKLPRVLLGCSFKSCTQVPNWILRRLSQRSLSSRDRPGF